MRPTDPLPDPVLERLRGLRRDELDDVTASRTLARAEAALAQHARPAAARRLARSFGWVPAGLALWGVLYAWCAVREMRRLFPSEGGRPQIAARTPTPVGASRSLPSARPAGSGAPLVLARSESARTF